MGKIAGQTPQVIFLNGKVSEAFVVDVNREWHHRRDEDVEAEVKLVTGDEG